MASYKQPCFHCGTYIDRDARYCPNCTSMSPLGTIAPIAAGKWKRTSLYVKAVVVLYM